MAIRIPQHKPLFGACRSVFEIQSWKSFGGLENTAASQKKHEFAIQSSPVYFSTKKPSSQRTPLYDLHTSLGAKMVDFGGWSMPLIYQDQSISESHIHTRKHCSIFDVSHMQQLVIHGNDRHEFWESVCVSDVKEQPENSGTLSLLTNENGGIIDDTVWMNTSRGHLFVVVNAGCAAKDLEYLTKKVLDFQKKGKAAQMGVVTVQERALIAVQGPEMSRVIQPGLKDSLDNLEFMQTTFCTLYGFEGCRITRCGYTGEDGVEISCLSKDAAPLCDILLKSREGQVRMAGLGARDSLRLEAGLCLYGNDINEQTTPVEANLTWTIGKRRRKEGGFPGAEKILPQIKSGVQKKRVGIISTGAPARKGYAIVDEKGEQVGEVTSGCPAPSLGTNISMGYVNTSLSKPGTPLRIKVRNQIVEGKVSKMPFVQANYYHAKGHKQS
ncbi:aminomethyltransferase, mitochondrial-like [Paramacrobiotus metropolitanus]|uniref:aminomethyltransferase, mitochondrial-like n=1 Tax=Paramacrobiotus metropolitanus TaxID=2943436 RepID=UPI0024463E5A|nr:aminomethyltransferase, mitochondrial-like [Paramacrobiotus metropolitanus]